MILGKSIDQLTTSETNLVYLVSSARKMFKLHPTPKVEPVPGLRIAPAKQNCRAAILAAFKTHRSGILFPRCGAVRLRRRETLSSGEDRRPTILRNRLGMSQKQLGREQIACSNPFPPSDGERPAVESILSDDSHTTFLRRL